MKFGQNYPDLDPAGNFDQVSLRLDKNCGFFINRELFSVWNFFMPQSLCMEKTKYLGSDQICQSRLFYGLFYLLILQFVKKYGLIYLTK